VPQAGPLIEGLPAEIVMADTAYDADHFRQAIVDKGALAVMYGRPPFRKVFGSVFGEAVGAVMYPACLCGRLKTAGPDGIRGRALPSSRRAVMHDDGTECSRSGMPTDFAICRCVLLAKGWRVSRWPARDRVGCG